jgi:branched-chain amino acid transport system substrate-binding protein
VNQGWRAFRRLRAAVPVLLALTLLAGCGSRVSAADVLADSGGSPVTITLPPDLLRQPGPDGAPPTLAQSVAAPTIAGNAPAGPIRAPNGAIVGGPNSRPGYNAPTRSTPEAASTAARATCTGPRSTVTLGQVGTFSGVVGAITASARFAMAAWAKDINARGGLACHPVQLFTEDDNADPARAAAAVGDLVARHHVIALVGSIVAFTSAGFVPVVTAAKLPAVGGDSTDPQWFTSPWMFPQGASLDDQAVGILKAGVAAGHRKVGLLYCVETSACTYVDKQIKDVGAKAAGADLVYDSPISITQTDFTAQCLNARNAGVDLLGLAMDGSSMTRVARSCAAINYRPLLAVGAPTFSLRDSEDPNLRAFGMVCESPVAPWMTTDTPALRAFHAAMARYAPNVKPDGESVLAWSAGILLEHTIATLSVVERAGDLTTGSVLAGLSRVHHDTLGGLTGPLTFTPGQRHAVSTGCIYFERLGPDGWTAPDGSRSICR